MNIEKRVEDLEKNVEAIAKILELLTVSLRKDDTGHLVQDVQGFTDDEIKLIANVLLEYLHAEYTYNFIKLRFVGLTDTGMQAVSVLLEKIYAMYPDGIEFGEDDTTNFQYKDWK